MRSDVLSDTGGGMIVAPVISAGQTAASIIADRTAFRILAGLAVFLSGFASLTYQVVWQRVLSQEVGVDANSMAIIVGIFMAGLGIGALVGGHITRGARHRLAIIYSLIELGIGLYGCIAIPAVRGVNHLLAIMGMDSLLIEAAANFLVLIPPMVLMGMTAPVVLAILTDAQEAVGTTVGVFYGLNIFGAAAGALVAGFVLIELAGLLASSVAAAMVSATAGGVFLFAAHRYPHHRLSSSAATAKAGERQGIAIHSHYAAAAVLLGFVTLAYEVVLFRVTSVHFMAHVYVFPLMLCGFLLMMCIGEVASGLIVDRLSPRHSSGYVSVLVLLGAVSAVFVFHSHGAALEQGVSRQWPQALTFVPVCMLPIVFQAAFFPAAAKLMTRPPEAGKIIGALLFWYTVGNLLGCFGSAFLLLELIGSVNTIRLCFALTLAGAFLLCIKQPRISFANGVGATFVAATMVLLAYCLPHDYYAKVIACADYVEGQEGVVTYHDRAPVAGVQINGTPSARIFRSSRHIPIREHNLAALMVVDPAFRPRRVLIVGMGSAGLVWGLNEYDFIERITVVELCPELAEFVRKYSDSEIVASLDSPRTEVAIGDGRRYLQRARARGDTFDLIQVGTFYPDVAGSANLYSRDLMETAGACLTPGGYFMTLDCVGIVPTALEVFPAGFLIDGLPYYAFFSRHSLSTASRRDIPLWLARSLTAHTADDMVAGDADSLVPFLSVKLLDVASFSDYPVNSDNRPTLEFRFLREMRGNYRDVRARVHKMDSGHLPAQQMEVAKSPDADP